MRRALIVNADDYGRTPGVSAGIRLAHLQGLVTGATVMVNSQGALDEVHRAQSQTPRLALGVHLNLTSGRPCTPPERLPSLVDAQGLFLRPEVHLARPQPVETDQVALEWRAQIEMFLETGAELDHLDSHHHLAASSPELWERCLSLAREFGCGVRLPVVPDPPPPSSIRPFTHSAAMEQLSRACVPHPDAFADGFYADQATLENLLSIVHGLQPGVTELMTHPGYADEALLATSIYARERDVELALLTDPAAFRTIEEEGVSLTTFRQALAAPP